MRTRIPRASACRIAGTDKTRRYGLSGTPLRLSHVTEQRRTRAEIFLHSAWFQVGWFGESMTPGRRAARTGRPLRPGRHPGAGGLERDAPRAECVENVAGHL